MKKVFISIFMFLITYTAFAGNFSGRLVISSDGNEHDKDDWAATSFALALIAAEGLQDNLTVYTFSDHIWGSNHDHSDATKQMRISAIDGGKQFGFNKTNFIEAVADPEAAYNAIKNEINSSSASNSLTIIAAGPMQVVGTALDRANPDKLKYVKVISHSTWNDKHSDNPSSWEHHSGWTWSEMTKKFKDVNFVHIIDQNGGTGYEGMRANKSKFQWLLSSPKSTSSWKWLYDRQVAAQKGNDFDASDAGMTLYLLTGIQKTDPSLAKEIMENGFNNVDSTTFEYTLSIDKNPVVDGSSLFLYTLPSDYSGGRTQFKIYNEAGDQILSFFDGSVNAGDNNRIFNRATDLINGTYTAKLLVSDKVVAEASVNIGETTSVDIGETTSEFDYSLVVAPNPITDNTVLYYNLPSNYSGELVKFLVKNSSGSTVLSFNDNTTTTGSNVRGFNKASTLNKGAYTMVLTVNGKVVDQIEFSK